MSEVITREEEIINIVKSIDYDALTPTNFIFIKTFMQIQAKNLPKKEVIDETEKKIQD